MKLLPIFTFLLSTVATFAQTPPPPGGPDDSATGPGGGVPIDQYAILFFIASAASLSLLAWKVYKKKNLA